MKKGTKKSVHLYDAQCISATTTTIHSENRLHSSVTLISCIDLLPQPPNKTQFFNLFQLHTSTVLKLTFAYRE